MKEKVKKAIEKYQCTGCIGGSDVSCFESAKDGCGCGGHMAGTGVVGIGKIFLGMPKGFNRLGRNLNLHPNIYEKFEDNDSNLKFNVPVFDTPTT